MARFDKYAPLLKKLEGGFSNHPNDPGKQTMFGVTLDTFREEFGQDKTVEDLKNITDAQWTRIMKSSYWDKAQADYINNQSVAEIIVDWVVNSGPAVLKKVQSIVGVSVDGVIGSISLAAINNHRQKCLHCKIWDARKDYYERIVKAKPSQKVFLQGWMNRLSNFVYDGKDM